MIEHFYIVTRTWSGTYRVPAATPQEAEAIVQASDERAQFIAGGMVGITVTPEAAPATDELT